MNNSFPVRLCYRCLNRYNKVSANIATVNQGAPDGENKRTILEFVETTTRGVYRRVVRSGLHSGHLCASKSTVQIEGKAYDVQLLIFDEKLRKSILPILVSLRIKLTFKFTAPGC